MREKTKKILYKISKIIWVIIGILLLITTIFMWVKMSTFSGSGFEGIAGTIALALLFATALGMFLGYLSITALFFFVRWLIKKLNKRKGNKK
jgi:membrane protein implicated in regulation of membrane protease activity